MLHGETDKWQGEVLIGFTSGRPKVIGENGILVGLWLGSVHLPKMACTSSQNWKGAQQSPAQDVALGGATWMAKLR